MLSDTQESDGEMLLRPADVLPTAVFFCQKVKEINELSSTGNIDS